MATKSGIIRVTATEDVPNTKLLPALRDAGMSDDHAIATVVGQASRLRHYAGKAESDAVKVDRNKVTFSNLAGVVRLGRGIEVDLAPKFLSDADDDWREDFIAIASVTGEGRILAGHVSATLAHVNDLASLIGHVFAEEFFAHRRTPLRVYQHRRWRDFSLDGDLEIDDALVPDPDGLPQRAIVRDLHNPFNALIKRAATLLLAEVRHPVVRTRLASVSGILGQQHPAPRHLPTLPSRHRRWQPLLDLAKQVVDGFEVSLRDGSTRAPGFLLRCWQAWERLLYLALRDAFGPAAVTPKEAYLWGRRGTAKIHVTPDLSIGTTATGIIDAKYKGRGDERQTAVSQSDLMEAAAFMAASGHDRIMLLYPRTAAGGPRWTTGEGSIFDRADLFDGKTVIGAEVEVRGYGGRGGRQLFTANLARGVTALLDDPTETLQPGRAW